jgi:hypothetical protein
VNREVNVTKRVQTAKGLRYCPVVLSANGRIKPDVVLINGKEEKHPEGAYYLEWRQGVKRVRLSRMVKNLKREIIPYYKRCDSLFTPR